MCSPNSLLAIWCVFDYLRSGFFRHMTSTYKNDDPFLAYYFWNVLIWSFLPLYSREVWWFRQSALKRMLNRILEPMFGVVLFCSKMTPIDNFFMYVWGEKSQFWIPSLLSFVP